MRVCGIDFETTGLDPKDHYVTEIGAIIFDGNTWDPIEEFSFLVHEPLALPLPEMITNLTGITDEMLRSQGIPPEMAFDKLYNFTEGFKIDAFIAHNAPFDKSFYYKEMQRACYDQSEYMGTPWYCSKTGVKTHQGKNCTKLSHLALDYGCLVDGSGLHRAINDVRIMGQMLKKTGLTFAQIKEWSDEPWVYLKANVSFDQKEVAKADGYSWEKIYGDYNSPLFQKTWVKRIKKSGLEAEQSRSVPFKREIIQPPT